MMQAFGAINPVLHGQLANPYNMQGLINCTLEVTDHMLIMHAASPVH